MWETSVSHWLQVCTRFGFQIGNCLTQGGRPTHVSHMLQISHTCFALCVTYVSIIFHLCFVCVPHMFCLMFDICVIYVSHMFRLCFTYDIRPSTGLYVCGQHTPTSRHVRVHVAVHVAVHVRDHVKDMAHNKPK